MMSKYIKPWNPLPSDITSANTLTGRAHLQMDAYAFVLTMSAMRLIDELPNSFKLA